MRSCPHCGQPASADAVLCSNCGNALPPPPPPGLSEQHTLVQPTVTGVVPPPPPYVTPTVVQPTYVAPTQIQPGQPPSPFVITLPSSEPPPRKRGSGVLLGMLLGFTIIAAVVVIALKLTDKKGAGSATPTSSALTTAASSAPPTTVEVPVTVIATVLLPAATTPLTTSTPQITPAVTTPAAVTTVPPLAGPGIPLVLRDPMSSGVSYADVSGSFALAQQLADALAADDWNLARQLEPAKSRFTDAQFNGYKGLDRASLILVDSRPEGDGYLNLVVSVANEQNGSQTTLYCLEWSASTATGFVTQHTGVVGKLIKLNGMVLPDAVVGDPSLLDLVMSRCVWR